MAPNPINLTRFGAMEVTKPCQFTGFSSVVRWLSFGVPPVCSVDATEAGSLEPSWKLARQPSGASERVFVGDGVGTASARMVRHRVGLTAGPLWTGVSFRLFFVRFQIGLHCFETGADWFLGCNRREEPIGTDVEPKNNKKPQKQPETKSGPKQNPRKAYTMLYQSGMGSGKGWCIGFF